MNTHLRHQVSLTAMGGGSIISKNGRMPQIDFFHMMEEHKDILAAGPRHASSSSSSDFPSSSSARYDEGLVLDRHVQHHIYFQNPFDHSIDCVSFDDVLGIEDEEDSDEDWGNDFYEVLDEDEDDEGEIQLPYPKVCGSSSASKKPTEEQIAAAKKAEKELLQQLAQEEAAAAESKRKSSKSSSTTSTNTPKKKKNKKKSTNKK